MFLDSFSDFSFVNPGNARPKRKKVAIAKDFEADPINPGTKKREAQLQFAAIMRAWNKKYFKPCPCCNNLVRPAALQSHYEAYHPGIKFTLQIAEQHSISTSISS